MFGLKETTIITGLALICATVLAAMGVIDGGKWAIVAGLATGGKSAQGMIDRSKWGNGK